jgi:signal recognition particle receptor subunit beta
MVVLNYTGEEINAKIVYYGPGLSGKTTNLENLYGQMPVDSKGQMVSMKTRTDRTLFFDFFPLELGEINGYRTRFLLYTVPGQVYYNATRKLVLKGADAVVFVADSAPDKLQENLESLRNLEDNLNEHGLSLDTIPWVIQYNKRDLPDCMPVQELHQHLNLMNVPAFEAIAMNGFGVYDTFKSVAGMLYQELKERLESGDVIATQGTDAEEGLRPSLPGSQGEDVNSAIDSALRETGVAPTRVEPHVPQNQAPVPDAPAPAPAPPAQPVQPAQPDQPAQAETPEQQWADPAPAEGEIPAVTQKAPSSSMPTPPKGVSPVTPPSPQSPPAPVVPVGPEPKNEEEQGMNKKDGEFSFVENEGELSPDIGRLVELDGSADNGVQKKEPPEFITDPMQSAKPAGKKEPPGFINDPIQSAETAAKPEIETVEAPVVTERKTEPAEQELVVPVVISRSQVRKTVPIKLRLEIRVIDD